jgi:prephenate dehydratase
VGRTTVGSVAFQGELGAYSELAAREYFGTGIDVSPSPTFVEVFEKVTSGAADAGIIPIENSLAGSIHENYDNLLEHELSIIGEIKLRIVHHLIVNPGVALTDVRRVISHPQALAQCRDFTRNLDDVAVEPVYDTAGAVRDVKKSGSRDTAAIASAQAAADYGLEILASSIESNHQNFTRFLAIERESAEDPGDKTTIVFALQHQPGMLFKTLGVFALRDIDLLKIESRPLLGSPWEYLFYLDIAGNMQDDNVRKAVDHLGELTVFLRVLGGYRHGKIADGSSVLDRTNAEDGAA